MYDLCDYVVRSKDGFALNPGSPFNIKNDSASLASFSLDNVLALVGQHCTKTGQVFSDEAIGRIRDPGRGQLWLTNAIFQKCVWTLCPPAFYHSNS